MLHLIIESRKINRILSKQSLSQKKRQSEQVLADDKFFHEMVDKFMDPSQNPLIKEVQDSIDYHNKIRKANEDFKNEFMKANNQVKQEEIVESITGSTQQ